MTEASRARVLGPLVLATLAMLVAGLRPRTAHAIEYEVFIDIQDEEDLYDLLVTDQISESTFDSLVDLMRQGVNLDEATREELYALPNLTYEQVDRILAYREEAGRIGNPASLVAAGVLPRPLVASLAPFLVVGVTEPPMTATRGFVRYRTAWTVDDDRVPPMSLQARVSTARDLTLGVAAVLDRDRIAPPVWDPNRDALTSTGTRVRPRLAKYYARWETDQWGIIGGTYRIGFGQRLVFDTSGRYTPNGFYLDDTVIRETQLARRCRESAGELPDSPCAGDLGARYVTPDYRVPEGLRGVAAGFKNVDLPQGWMQGYGWFSAQGRSIYQYEIHDRNVCADPRDDDDPLCGAPSVYQTLDDPLAPTSRLSFQTLPNMYNEYLGGGNVGYWYDRRTHVGVTGYGATTQWLVDGADLDFQEWSRFPGGGPWGAVGADASWGRKWADVFLEVAHSFDSMVDEGTGGPAVVARHTVTVDTHEVELSARYYDDRYANPYSRAISAADELDGLRARDEAGGRIRYNAMIARRLSLRSAFDFWVQPSEGQPKTHVFLRTDYQATPWFRPGVWFDYQNRDLRTGDRDDCYFVPVDEDENGEPIPCQGERTQLTGRARFDPHERVYLTLQYRHDFSDDDSYTDRFRQDVATFFLLSATPTDALRMRFRVRYDFDDISDNTRLEQTLWGYLELAYELRRWFVPRVRYDLRYWLDDRDRTRLRTPDPEHWVHFELESRF